ncbi:hypothetical protein H0H87_007871, partial [Tephrocybe sp. NHM501043]
FPEFLDRAKAVGLSGVNLPFWRNWENSEPALFIVPEILHTCHKFFFDHVLLWCKAIVGAEDLDARFRALHKRIGYRHFAGGVTHINQMTGREHRDIQRTLVAVIAGKVTGGFLKAIRALIDFIYIAQYPRHTQRTISAMEQALQEFHENKQSILDAGARAGKKGVMTHFNIPKLELFHSFARAIKLSGSLLQYTADVSERLLITHCKHTFKATNHRAFWDEQCARILDRQERIRLFDLFTVLRGSDLSLLNEVVSSEDSFITDMLIDSHPEAAWVARILPEARLRGPRLNRNLFATKGSIILDSTTAILLNVTPHQTLGLNETAIQFQLDDLKLALQKYAAGSRPTAPLPRDQQHLDYGFDKIDIWHKFRIQMSSVHHGDVIMPAETVQAFPPTDKSVYGVCDTVLVKDPTSQSTAVDGFQVVQVRLVFRAVPRANTQLAQIFDKPLAYVQYFRFSGKRDQNGLLLEEEDVDMYRLKRHRRTNKTPVGGIIGLTDVARPVEIIPVFGEKCDPRLTSENSLDIWEDYYLNNFSDKEVYAVLLNEYDGLSGEM